MNTKKQELPKPSLSLKKETLRTLPHNDTDVLEGVVGGTKTVFDNARQITVES